MRPQRRNAWLCTKEMSDDAWSWPALEHRGCRWQERRCSAQRFRMVVRNLAWPLGAAIFLGAAQRQREHWCFRRPEREDSPPARWKGPVLRCQRADCTKPVCRLVERDWFSRSIRVEYPPNVRWIGRAMGQVIVLGQFVEGMILNTPALVANPADGRNVVTIEFPLDQPSPATLLR
jgi:hypothetical protein